MIYFEFYSLIIPKMVLEFKYPGGVEQFKLSIPNHSYLEDEHLASARFLKISEIDQFLEFVRKQGLHYDKEENYSNDFAVMSWIGPWWPADWLQTQVFKCSLKDE